MDTVPCSRILAPDGVMPPEFTGSSKNIRIFYGQADHKLPVSFFFSAIFFSPSPPPSQAISPTYGHGGHIYVADLPSPLWSSFTSSPSYSLQNGSTEKQKVAPLTLTLLNGLLKHWASILYYRVVRRGDSTKSRERRRMWLILIFVIGELKNV